MTQGKKVRIGLILAAVVWTIVAGVASTVIYLRAPLIFEVGGAPIFVSTITWLIAVWPLGLGALVGTMLPAGRPRRVLWVAWIVAVLGSLTWVAMYLSVSEPVTEASASEGQVATDRTTLLVAVDAMSWSAILPMVRRGELPTIARLMDQGSYGVLTSVRSYRESVDKWGYWSPVVWTSVATGVSPRRHGITDFVLGDGPSRGGMAASTHRKAPAFWDLFSAFGRRVAVVGWWATWPAEKVDGYLVSSHVGLRGWRTHELRSKGLTYPEELADELALRRDDPESVEGWVNEEIFPFDQYPVLGKTERETMYSVLWQDRLYLDATLHLIKERDPVDLYCVYFEGIDALSHHFWKAFADLEESDVVTLPQGFREHAKIVPTYYKVIDSYVADLLETLPEETTVILVSDHGFRLDSTHVKGGDHSPYGVILAKGEGIRAGESLNLDPLGSLRERLHDRTDVLDVLPTLLYLHGLPIARSLQGEILSPMLTDRFLDTQPVVKVDSYGDFSKGRQVDVQLDAGASEEYEQRLRSLGYIQ